MPADDFFGGAYTEWVEPDRDEAAWSIAASFNTLVRGWCFDPSRDDCESEVRGELELDPWVVETTDAAWLARGRRTLDLAVTWWADLPSDWQTRFVEQAGVAVREIAVAVAAGRTAEELVTDQTWLAALGEQLLRPWLQPRRVIALEGGVLDRSEDAGPVLAQLAINVYARKAMGIPSTQGTVAPGLPSQLPNRSGLVKVGGPNATDRTDASFLVRGDRLDARATQTIEAMVDRRPDARHFKGGLNLDRTSGQQRRPYPTGHWSISSRHEVSSERSTVEQHLEWLLDLLHPHVAELRHLASDLDLEFQFGCFYSQTGLNAEWTLSSRTLERIAALGASFWFDSYASWDNDEDDEDDAVEGDEDDGTDGRRGDADGVAEPRP